MAAGFPAKTNFADGTTLPASNLNDVTGTLNLINPTAKGDLFVGSAANTYTKLSVGADALVLTASSTATTGIAWASIPSGGMTLISSGTPSAATTYTVSSIPQTYKNLYIVLEKIQGGTSATQLQIRANGTSGSGATIQTYVSGAQTSVVNTSGSYFLIGQASGAGYQISGTVTLPNYTSTTLAAKSVFAHSSAIQITGGMNYPYMTSGSLNGTGTSSVAVGLGAITSLEFSYSAGSFAAVGTISIYGVN